MPGDRDPVGGVVRATDDRRGTLLPVATEGAGTVQVVRGGDGGSIFGGAQYDTAWASGRVDAKLENIGHGGRASDISHVLPVQGRPAELSGGGMPRTISDKDGDAGPFSVPACPGHRGHFGGGKNPPTHGAPDATCWSPGVR